MRAVGTERFQATSENHDAIWQKRIFRVPTLYMRNPARYSANIAGNFSSSV